ncbi:MAG: TIGR03016 family PEP-CTERM system-associated outer membrane protein [Burkholderiales bacterium]
MTARPPVCPSRANAACAQPHARLSCFIVLLVAGLSTGWASAQSLPGGILDGGGQTSSGIGGGAVGVGTQSGIAQPGVPQAGAAGQRGLTIVPRIEAGIVYSDNVAFSTTNRRGGFIYELSPGIRVSSYGGRIRGFLDYSLRGFAYSGGTSPATVHNELNALATLEAVDRKVFVDVGGRISRATVSAFGVQTSDASRPNANSTELRTYYVSPYARGRFSDLANYELRYRSAVSSSDSTPSSDATIQEFIGSLREDYPSRHVGWALEGSRSIVDYKNTRDIDASMVRGVLSLIFNPQFRVFGSTGREVNNFLSEEQRSYTTYGAGLRWRPSPLTRLEVEQQRRFFGFGHTYLAEVRTPQSALRFTDLKDIVIGRGFNDIGSQGSVYDLLFSQFTSVEPDPDKRAALVNQYLQRNGFNGNSAVNSSVFASSTTLRRDQQFSYSLIGKRDVVTLLFGQTNSRLLDAASAVDGDFARANEIRQRRIGATYAHTLTPSATVNVTGLIQKVSSPGNALGTNLRTISINYTSRLAPKLFFSAGAIKSFSSGGGVSSFDELSIFSRVSLRF